MTFFEIDPVVVRVASDPALLHATCRTRPVRPAIVLGDARLSLAAEPAGRFDLLVLDAFSSDSPAGPPADGRGRRRRGPHASSRTASSRSTSRTATTTSRQPSRPRRSAQGLTVLERWHAVGAVHEPGETPSHWLAASRDAAAIAALRAEGWTDVVPADHPFTDDYADLIRYLHLGS